MKQIALATVLVLALLTSVVASNALSPSVSANPSGDFPQLAMPIEYVNYTITTVNGALWAQIDGIYPISLLQEADCGFSGVLPMVYPMPPNATNIHVTVDDHELNWSTRPDSELHQTAIGNWTLIYCALSNIEENFQLTIHYEHPIETVNDSSIFLYDLNISPYLSPQSPTSTAYFAFHFQTGLSSIQVYTAPPDSTPSQWQPKTYTQTQEGTTPVVLVDMYSQYGETLPGDLAVVFTDAQSSIEGLSPSAAQPKTSNDNYLTWLVPVALDVFLVALILVLKRKAVTSLFSRKNPNKSSAQP
jgi:hypothetical protein